MPKKVICSVRDCKTGTHEGCKLFSLPCGNESLGEPQRRLTWLIALGLPHHLPSQHLKVCSKHFCSDDFEIGLKYGTQKFLRLKPEAVPHLGVPNESPCHVKNKEKAGSSVSGLIVPTKSIAHLIEEKDDSDDSVYLVQQCPELRSFTNNAIGAPTPPMFNIQGTIPENTSAPSISPSDRDVKVALPLCMSTYPLCRICYNPAINKKTDSSIDLERNDVKTVKNMLNLLLPTSKWEMYRNPVICDICLELVKKSFNLIQSYIATTECLNKLFENTKSSVPSNVDLVIMRKTAPDAKYSTLKSSAAPVVLQRTHTANLVQRKTSSSIKKSGKNYNKVKECVNVKRTNPQPVWPTKIRKEQPNSRGDKTFCCCVCYATFPDSYTLMVHLNSKECAGPRQKSDLVITGL